MNAKSMFQKILPHLLIILGFVLISTIYFFPSLQGKTLRQGDLVNVKGTHHSITEYNKQHPNQPALWTDASFSGMPTLIMGMGENNNIFMQIKSYLSFGLPKKTIAILFMFLLSFYIFCL